MNKYINIVKRVFNASHQIAKHSINNNIQRINFNSIRSITTTQPIYDVNEEVNKKLMEFFDDKKNWNENEVKHGRSWNLPELRIKSNTDLHKLWYILLKERNMLITMEQEYKNEWKWWASPERIDKVKESMKNIESVVRERNRAYFELETGEDGERSGRVTSNVLGLRVYRKYVECEVPLWLDQKWIEKSTATYGGFAVRKFLKLYREKLYNEKRKAVNRDRNHLIRLLSRFPDLDQQMLAEKYPHIDFDTLRKKDRFRGHFVPKVEENSI